MPLLVGLLGCGDAGPRVDAAPPASAPRSDVGPAFAPATERHPGPCVGWVDGEGDDPLDGTFDARFVFDYERDRATGYTVVFAAETVARGHVGWLYDDAGRLVGETYDCDGGGGAPEERTEFVFDADGRRTFGLRRNEPSHAAVCGPVEPSAPGRSDPVAVMRARHDWSAELTALRVDVAALAPYDAVARYYYDEDGRIHAEAWDNDGDGIYDEVLRFVRDRFGNLTREYHDDGPDGIVDVEVRYAHDCW